MSDCIFTHDEIVKKQIAYFKKFNLSALSQKRMENIVNSYLTIVSGIAEYSIAVQNKEVVHNKAPPNYQTH